MIKRFDIMDAVGLPHSPRSPCGKVLRLFVDDRTYSILAEISDRTGRTIEDLAEAAIAEEAIRSIPPNCR